MNKFEQLGLNESLLLAIKDLGFENPSEVQEKAIPVLLEQNTDLVALAQTGTGKTAAFGFPLIQKIDAENKNTQALILSPTRELCLQITNEIKLYSKYIKGLHTVAVYGGASITEQAREVKRGAQIIVATPGRMQDMINRGLVNIKNIDFCILDEADEMLNMGFYEDICSILSDTPDEKNTWLFSATMPAEVARIAKQFMSNPEEITVGHKNSGSATVSHEYYVVNARDRYEALKRLADANPEAVGKYLSGNFHLIPTANDPDFIPAVRSICLKENIKILMPLVTKELFPLSENKDEFRTIGVHILVSDESALSIANDKGRLYQHLEQFNVRVPNYKIVNTWEEFEEGLKQLDYPNQKDEYQKNSILIKEENLIQFKFEDIL